MVQNETETLSTTAVPLRPPATVASLARMGSSFPSCLSFMRSLVRRLHSEAWSVGPSRIELDDQGYGCMVYTAHGPERRYSLVGFSNALNDDQRTDRVIATAWDASFVLFDGEPGHDDIDRLRDSVPKQEAGRFEATELVLARANRSMRLFEHVCESLANGRQPDIRLISEIGYLMRTTAVYGNGKFGVADRSRIETRAELAGPFQAEMLTLYMIRMFTTDLVEHIARRRSPVSYVPLDRSLKRHLGIGNATGLGMAPFLVTHPRLLNNWLMAKETALARVRSVSDVAPDKTERLHALLVRARQHVAEWRVDDKRQSERIDQLVYDLEIVTSWLGEEELQKGTDKPWNLVYEKSVQSLSLEGQELLVSLLIETYPEYCQDLVHKMAADETYKLDASDTVEQMTKRLKYQYDWALNIDFDSRSQTCYFWYVSENKLEPRFGLRYEEAGVDREMPLAVARDINLLYQDLQSCLPMQSLAEFLLTYPQHRQIVRRVQSLDGYPYGEIQDNLIGSECLPLDILRFKLAFFGAAKFDPKSDLWTRITLYQGAPLYDELDKADADDWWLPVSPGSTGCVSH